MATLTGNAINTSYQGLIKFDDNGAVDPTTLKQITDGTGGSLPIQVSQVQTKFQSLVDFTDTTVSGLPSAAGLVNGTGTDSLKQADSLVTNAATASGPQSIALGNGAVSNSNQSIAIGNFSEATSVGSAAVGEYASANALYASAWGRTAYARADGSVAFGQQAGVPFGVNGGVAMGRQVVADLADTTHVRALKIVAPDGGTGGNGITMLSPNGTAGLITLTDASELAVDGTPIGGGGGSAFTPVIVSGDIQDLDLGTYNFFESNLTNNVTLTFSNIPTEAEFQYSFSGYAGYNAGSLTYQQNKSVGRDAQDLHFKPDGTQVYFITDGGADEITAHNLSTPWDISTLNSTPVATFDTSAQATAARGLTMSPDGTKMYITSEVINTAFEYTLSTAFDITTASYSGNSLTGLENQPWGSFIKPDGTSFYVSGGDGTLVQYNLSTPFDISTGTFAGEFASGYGTYTQGIALNADGSKVFSVSTGTDTVYEFDLTTPYDITTAVDNGISTYIGANAGNPLDIFFKPGGSELYVVGSSNIYEYESIGAPSVTLPASVQNPPTLPYEKNQVVTYTFYTLDSGTTVYLTNSSVKQILAQPGLINGFGSNSIQSAANLTLDPANAAGLNSIAIGNDAIALKPSCIAIGDNVDVDAGGGGTGAIGIGENIKVRRDTGIAIGKNIGLSISDFDSYREIAIGNNVNVQGGDSIGLGSNVNVTGTGTNNKVAIGNGAVASANGSVALGYQVTASTDNTATVNLLQIAAYATMNYADDTAAATGGIPLGGVYHTDGALKIRIA